MVPPAPSHPLNTLKHQQFLGPRQPSTCWPGTALGAGRTAPTAGAPRHTGPPPGREARRRGPQGRPDLTAHSCLPASPQEVSSALRRGGSGPASPSAPRCVHRRAPGSGSSSAIICHQRSGPWGSAHRSPCPCCPGSETQTTRTVCLATSPRAPACQRPGSSYEPEVPLQSPGLPHEIRQALCYAAGWAG